MFYDKYRNKDFKETPLLDNLDQIIEIISKSYEGDIFRARLLLIYDVILRKEHEKRPPAYYHTNQFRSGLDVMNVLFDIINQIAGYH